MRAKKKEKTENQVFVDKMLSIIISIPLLSAMAMYLFSQFFQFPKSLLVGSIDGWLGFTGGVIGGTLTLFGVSITLREQNKLRDLDERKRDNEKKEEDRKKYMPYFSLFYSHTNICALNNIPNHNFFNIFYFDSHSIKNESNLDRVSIVYARIKNVSPSPATNIKFIGTELSIFDTSNFDNKILSTEICNQNDPMFHKTEGIHASAGYIPSNESIPIAVFIPDIRGFESISLHLLFNLFYETNLGYKYMQPGKLLISIDFIIDIDDNYTTKFNPNKIQFSHDMNAPILISEEAKK